MADSLPRRFGPYILLHRLGSGGQGDVHLARPAQALTGLPSVVVIKRLHSELSTESDFVRRFRHEATIAVALDTPHVAKVYDAGRVGEHIYIVMEYIPGWPLSRVLKFYARSQRLPPIPSSIRIVRAALEGLRALHEAKDESGKALGIVHRDLAPKNIMLGEDGIARLIDLGLGRSEKRDWKTATGIVMGTPGYMSPEQVVAETVDQRSDLYVMGIVLFEILTMRRFIKSGPVGKMLRDSVNPQLIPPTKVRAEIPRALDALALKALAPEPRDRFQSARDFIAALSQAAPAESEQVDAQTMVGQILWEEQTAAGTKIRELISMTLPAVEPHELGPEPEQFATRAGVSPFAETLGGDEAPTIPKLIERRSSERALGPKKKSAPRFTATTALLLLLPLTFALGIAFESLRRKHEDAQTTAPTQVAEPAPRRLNAVQAPPRRVSVVRAPQEPERGTRVTSIGQRWKDCIDQLGDTNSTERSYQLSKFAMAGASTAQSTPATEGFLRRCKQKVEAARSSIASPARAPSASTPKSTKPAPEVSPEPVKEQPRPKEEETLTISALDAKRKALLQRASKLRSKVANDPDRKRALDKIVFTLAQGRGLPNDRLTQIAGELDKLGL